MENNPWYYKINGELIKRKKPCLDGSYVHIKTWTGCYRVYSVNINHFTIKKNNELKKIHWDCFVCLKGEGTSEEALLKRRLRSLSETIQTNVNQQLLINTFINQELKNLRKKIA